MATTMSTFYTTFKNLALSGVTSLSQPPTLNDLSTARMPCKWVDSANIEEAALRARGTGGERSLTCRLVVVVSPHGQSRHEKRWSDTLTMVDTVNAGIKTVASKSTAWTVTADPMFLDGFFAVVATITTTEFGV